MSDPFENPEDVYFHQLEDCPCPEHTDVLLTVANDGSLCIDATKEYQSDSLTLDWVGAKRLLRALDAYQEYCARDSNNNGLCYKGIATGSAPVQLTMQNSFLGTLRCSDPKVALGLSLDIDIAAGRITIKEDKRVVIVLDAGQAISLLSLLQAMTTFNGIQLLPGEDGQGAQYFLGFPLLG